MSALDRVHLVLMRTREPQNLGAAARAMKNAGLSRLTLVDPVTSDLVTARRVAVHAEELLAAPRIAASIGEAAADAQWVVGTTSRRLGGKQRLTPREVAREAMRRGGNVALVFGDEESGLSNHDLLCCHAASFIPAADAQPSFNLAQAVVVYAYELFAAAREGLAEEAPVRAQEAELQQLEATLRGLLTRAGFAEPDRRRHGVRDLAQTLRRADLTPAEARLWQAALIGATRAIERG